MSAIVEKLLARAWNAAASRKTRKQSYAEASRVDFGFLIKDGALTKFPFYLSQGRRAEHIAILGKTGSGKSFFLRHLANQDIGSNHGFVYFDLHGDATAFLLSALAEREQRERVDLSEKVIVINPADPVYSVGLNVLEAADTRESFVQIAEFAQILKTRWHLDSFGARTEELLRNALYVLRDNEMTLIELSPLLTNPAFRASCVRNVQNYEVGSYFTTRYDQASEAMQAVMRDAVLNKISVFTADAVFFFKGRIAFCHLDGSAGDAAGAPSCLVAYGRQREANPRLGTCRKAYRAQGRPKRETRVDFPSNRMKLLTASSGINRA